MEDIFSASFFVYSSMLVSLTFLGTVTFLQLLIKSSMFSYSLLSCGVTLPDSVAFWSAFFWGSCSPTFLCDLFLLCLCPSLCSVSQLSCQQSIWCSCIWPFLRHSTDCETTWTYTAEFLCYETELESIWSVRNAMKHFGNRVRSWTVSRICISFTRAVPLAIVGWRSKGGTILYFVYPLCDLCKIHLLIIQYFDTNIVNVSSYSCFIYCLLKLISL